jgi:hypothetical protein
MRRPLPQPNELPRRYYRPERRLCATCGALLKRHHVLWRKRLVLLDGLTYVASWGYCCPNTGCAHSNVVHRSTEAEQLHLGRGQFGRDVVVQVGYWRFWQHLTVPELHARLSDELHLPISERQVLNLLGDFLALLRAAQPSKLTGLRSSLAARSGLIAAIDGMQPEKGDQSLYIVRDPRLGMTYCAEHVAESGAATLQEQVLQPLQALAEQLGLPLLGVVSDAQESIRLAVRATWPGLPHQCCQFHCLRDAGALTFAADRGMKTALKQRFRNRLSDIERRIAKLPETDRWRPILADYALAIHATLLEGGVAPFDLGGVRIFDDLMALAASLRRCQEKGGTVCYAS